eukprot:scaffold17319_cov169-Skeletonema_dohrnii-CCMP3373.AAC.3
MMCRRQKPPSLEKAPPSHNQDDHVASPTMPIIRQQQRGDSPTVLDDNGRTTSFQRQVVRDYCAMRCRKRGQPH